MNTVYKIKNKFLKNKIYVSAWLIALATVVFFNNMSSSSQSFMGITTSKETNINLEHSVIIQNINVLSGQYVSKGDLLGVLKRPELTLKISEVNRHIAELSAELNQNLNLANSLSSIKREKNNLNSEDLLSIQLKNTEEELKALLKEQENLYVFSDFDGYVGSINFKNGESVSPYQPIITIYSKTPTMVQGFIHETLSHKVLENTDVIIKNINGDKTIASKVFSVGKRIIELPERFKKHASDVAWGREVMVKIPKDNNFLLGEKVFLEINRNSKKINLINTAVAEPDFKLNFKESIYKDIIAPNSFIDDHLLEPSGLTFNQELNKFMMISDDTKGNKPFIYLLGKDAVLESHVMNVSNLDEINDVEAISEDENNNVYIISSMSENKKGKVTKNRKLFVKIKRDGLSLKAESEIDLYEVFEKLVKKNPKSKVSLALKTKKNKFNINVEGMIVKGNSAYLGLREPVGQNKNIIILKISNLDQFFTSDKKEIDSISLWRTFELPVTNQVDRNEGISGLAFDDNKLYVLTANNDKLDRGRLLVTTFTQKTDLIELKVFKENRPEGLGIDPVNKKAYVVFDKNSRDNPLKVAIVDLKDK